MFGSFDRSLVEVKKKEYETESGNNLIHKPSETEREEKAKKEKNNKETKR